MARDQKGQKAEAKINGLAKDVEIKARQVAKEYITEEIKGYLFIAGGILLLGYALGYFQLLNWVLIAGSIGLILYGAKLSNLRKKTEQLIEAAKKRYKKK